MTGTAYPGPFVPDNPTRRLPWILVIAVLLVLLGVLGMGRILTPPARPPVKSRPLQARIYELPASHGAAAAKSPARERHSAHARSAHRQSQSHPQHTAIAHSHGHGKVATSHASSSAALALPSHKHKGKSASRSRPASHRSPSINWANLQSQVNSALNQSTPSLPQVHDPNTVVAHYYLASLMEKLQRVGDMNDPTNLTGMPVIKLEIGTHGELLKVTLLNSSGNDQLDQDAMQIARDAAPFAPFPDKLKSQTQKIALVCYMKFVGYRQLYAGY